MDISCRCNNGFQILCPVKLHQLSLQFGCDYPNCQPNSIIGIILKKIENFIGRLLKIDACISATLRGRYARLCVEINLDQPVIPSIQIGPYNQVIEYEGQDQLCKQCGNVGKHQTICPSIHHNIKILHNSRNQGSTRLKSSKYRSGTQLLSMKKVSTGSDSQPSEPDPYDLFPVPASKLRLDRSYSPLVCYFDM
ncbi:uncharacterized protein LOC132633876 [Lycium barbarum]|uniref:uncharacterized protein LOC132633876 n=1 Tax=Lycium barbarum TaxID=112863 RepID=UPI00293F5B10|nr:uncharacterized protein LOC132633876 [Lycium barbarum]